MVTSQAICHCSNCRHYTGSMFSNNYVVANEGFKVSGGPLKEITKIAASGNTITNCFCGDCGESKDFHLSFPTHGGCSTLSMSLIGLLQAPQCTGTAMALEAHMG